MDTNVQALKGLYAALGGEASDVADLQTSAEVIVALEAVAEAAATELPAVKKVDEGKVLTVNGNGKWSAKLPESEIDDEEASETKTYSSSKIASLIPEDELPTVTTSDNGKILTVKGGEWSKETPNSVYDSIVGSFSDGSYTVTFSNLTRSGAKTKNKENVGYYVTFSATGGDLSLIGDLFPTFNKSVGNAGALSFQNILLDSSDNVYLVIATVSEQDVVTVKAIKLN